MSSLDASSLRLPTATITTTTTTNEKTRPLFLYPRSPERTKTIVNAVVVGGAYGFAQGTVLGIWQDTAVGVHGLSNAFNMALWSGVFFILREQIISPALLQLRLTEDHKRRYLLARLASPKHYLASDPPLEPERWNHVRYRNLVDTGLTGGILGLGAPHLYRYLLHASGYDALVKLPRATKIVTFLTCAVGTSLLQSAYNSYLVHDIKLHEAYDAIGPIPNVDITRVRAQEREDLNRVALYAGVMRQAEEKKKREAAQKEYQAHPFGSSFFGADGGTGDVKPGQKVGVEPGYEWYTWARFRRDALPSGRFISLEERIENEKGRRELLKSQLKEVKLELEDLGEVMELVLGEELSDPSVAVMLDERPEDQEEKVDLDDLGFIKKAFGGFRS